MHRIVQCKKIPRSYIQSFLNIFKASLKTKRNHDDILNNLEATFAYKKPNKGYYQKLPCSIQEKSKTLNSYQTNPNTHIQNFHKEEILSFEGSYMSTQAWG